MTAARIGVVLAGGRATRMGGDKAGAMLHGQTLLERAVCTVEAAGLEPRVCVRSGTKLPVLERPPGAEMWSEPRGVEAGAHPLAGLAYALTQAGEPIVALPVDLPLLPPEVLTALAAWPNPFVIVGARGRPAALVVRLGPEHADALAAAASNGAPALRTLVGLGACVIDLSELTPGLDAARALRNVNTPEDLETVAALTKR